MTVRAPSATASSAEAARSALSGPFRETADSPIYRQIYARVRDAIADGRIAAGARLPSTRSLAAEIGVARGTVDTAYALLAGEGFIIARGAAGTVVAPRLTIALPRGAAARGPRPDGSALPGAGMAVRPFQMGLPALDVFPRKLWARLTARAARSLGAADLAYPDPAGQQRLRDAIAGYLATARGVSCGPDQILVTSGYQGGLGLIARLLLRPGDAVWLEDPCYFMARDALAAVGAELVPVPVDGDGLHVAAGAARGPAAKLALATPSHQNPLGMALSLQRRLELLAWAQDADAYVVEDDYDGEFHYEGRPLPALKSLDRRDRVFYAGTFSKTLFPSLRLGYLVVPEPLVPLFQAGNRLFQGGPGLLEQMVTAAFLEEGHFARHLRRMRTLYAARRAALRSAIAAGFGRRLEIESRPGGMHILARLGPDEDDRALAAVADRAGLAVEPLSRFAVARDCGRGLLLSFTNIAEPDAPEAVRRLADAIGPALGLAA